MSLPLHNGDSTSPYARRLSEDIKKANSLNRGWELVPSDYRGAANRRDMNPYSNFNTSDINFFSTEQGLHNLMLKAQLGENEENLQTILGQQIDRAREGRSTLIGGNQLREQRLKEFDEGFKWNQPSGFERQALINDFGLKLPLAKLAEFGDPVVIPDISPLRNLLEELYNSHPSKSRLQAIEHELHNILDYLSSPSVDLVALIMKLPELLSTDVFGYIKGKLADSDLRVQQLLAEADAARRARDLAFHADDIPEAELQHLKEVAVLEKLMEIIRERLTDLLMGSADTGNFRSMIDTFMDDLQKGLAQLKREKQLIWKDTKADLETMHTKGTEEDIRHREGTAAYTDFQRRSMDALNDNAKQQDMLWSKIIELTEAMKDLGDQRYQIVNDHVIESEKEAKRISYYREYLAVADSHRRNLTDVLANTETSLKAIAIIEEIILKGSGKLDPTKLDAELEQMKLDEQQFYLKVFRRYMLSSGDLLQKKEKRLNGIQKLYRGLEFQIEIAKDSLDPDMESYKQQERALAKKRDDLVATCHHLRTNMEKEHGFFKSVEEILEENQVDFKDPAIELQEMTIDEKARFLAVQKKYVAVDQSEVDSEAVHIRKLDQQKKLQQENSMERKRMRAVGSPARQGGGAGPGSRPTSAGPLRTPAASNGSGLNGSGYPTYPLSSSTPSRYS